MSALPVATLLTPITAESPAGPDLAHDPAFLALERAATGTPEREIGNLLVPASPPRWHEVMEQALALSQRSRDLRLAVLMVRAGARTTGLSGAADGLQLVVGLLERHWDSVHPVLDASDGGDPTQRLNTLWALGQFDTGLADLRAATVGPAALGLTLRTMELAWSKAEPLGSEKRPDATALIEPLRAAQAAHPGTLASLQTFDAACEQLVTTLEARAPGHGLDLKPLLRLAGACRQAGAALGGAGSTASGGAATDVISVHADVGSSPVSEARPRSRDDVVRLLETACQWIELNEPSNPAPLLIRRAQRLMSKSFLEIVKDLAPGGVREFETLAGITPP